jgi:hypothetical protein
MSSPQVLLALGLIHMPFHTISFLIGIIHLKLAEPTMTFVIFQVFIDKTSNQG